MSSFIFREVVGDLFSAPIIYSLAHCVAADMNMGAGIAVKFRDTFKQIQKLKDQGAKAGGLAVLKDQSRFIYYLVSKNKTYTQPTYKDLFSSLHMMKTHMVTKCCFYRIILPFLMCVYHCFSLQEQNDVTKLAIPRIGCGLDGLEWDKVKDLLHEVFGNESVEIVVYNYSAKST